MLFLLPNTYGIEIPSTIMAHLAPQLDPGAVVLFGDDATPEKAVQAINQLNPPYVFTTGHGCPCATTLQNKKVFVSLAQPDMSRGYCSQNRNLDIFKGRVVHILSCWTGKLLAPELVKHGARAVFAYVDEFLFLLPKDGRTIDTVVASPFLSAMTTDTALFSGHTAGRAFEASQKAYEKWINYFYTGAGSRLDGAPLVLRILVADKGIARLFGDRTATITKPRQVQAKLGLPLEVEGAKADFAPLLVIGALLLLGGQAGGS